MTRPTIAIAIESESLLHRLIDDEQMERLRGIADVAGPVCTRAAPVLSADARGAELLITGWGAPSLDEAMLEAMPRLRTVVHAAGSVKRVVTPELWRRGIRVSSAAAVNAVPVAEYTLAMILLALKDTRAAELAYRASGELGRSQPHSSAGSYGAKVGIVGASRIGRRVIELLRPFDVLVNVYDPSITALDAAVLGAGQMSLEDLLRTSDLVSLHAPSLPETAQMIGVAQLKLLRDGATLVNTARGRLVDTDALVAELMSGRLRAVLDVTDPEPLPLGHPLLAAPGLTLTPHLAGSVGNELGRIGRFVVDEIESFFRAGWLSGEVMMIDLPRIA